MDGPGDEASSSNKVMELDDDEGSRAENISRDIMKSDWKGCVGQGDLAA